MNTYRVFEELKASLGEPAAKALVETLGGMFEELKNTVTKEDFRLLGESIDASVSRLDGAMIRLAEAQTRTETRIEELAEGQQRLFEAQARTEGRLNELAQAQARTEGRLNELAQAQTRTEGRLNELAQAQTRTEERLNELAQAQTRTEERLNELAQAQTRTEERLNELAQAQTRTETEVKSLAVALERLTIRTDAVVGRTFEIQFRDRLTAYLGRFLRRGKLLANDELLDLIEPKVTEREVDDFLRADAVASGLVDGVKSYVVVEVSSTGDIDDILRAQRRADVLRKAGLAAVPLVACDAISPESLAFAKLREVRVWCNGSMVEAAA
jgi:DNA repair exonuclease SbcCD ATPase subunit